MQRRIIRKWRPSLALVLGGTLAVVLSLPLSGIVAVRYLWPVLGYREAVWLVGALVLAATVVLGWMLWRILFRPMTALRARAAQIRSGAPDGLEPLDHYGTSDMQALGQAMLDMGRVLTSREAVLRGYADHVTHELKSPLTVLRGAAELLDSPGLSEEERRHLLDRIDGAADRMTALLDAQRALARAQEPALGGMTRVSALLDDIRMEFPGVEIVLDEDHEVALTPEALRLVLDHMLSNAAAHGATRLTLGAAPDRLTIRDNGPGVSAGNRDRIFDPFFTTRRDDGGTGMGLSIVRRILDAHGAEIRLLPDGPGAGFEISY